MSRKWIIRTLGICASAYVGSYAVLAAFGSYGFQQSGRVRYSFGLSASDLEMWQPKYARFQSNFRTIDGKEVARGNALGYFYSPLIALDRMLFHETRTITDLNRAISPARQGE